MKILKLERQENETFFWEIVVALAFLLNLLLWVVIAYVAGFAPDSKMMGIAAGLSMTTLAVIFIGLKKGVLPIERIFVRI